MEIAGDGIKAMMASVEDGTTGNGNDGGNKSSGSSDGTISGGRPNVGGWRISACATAEEHE